MKVRHNDQNWIVTKSLEDFEKLNSVLVKEHPEIKFPSIKEAVDNHEINLGKTVGRKQRHLEEYFKVIFLAN